MKTNMGSESGADVYGRVPDRQTIPASGPERRAGLPPCPTRCIGRRCRKTVAHRFQPGGPWVCSGCGCPREDVPDA